MNQTTNPTMIIDIRRRTEGELLQTPFTIDELRRMTMLGIDTSAPQLEVVFSYAEVDPTTVVGIDDGLVFVKKILRGRLNEGFILDQQVEEPLLETLDAFIEATSSKKNEGMVVLEFGSVRQSCFAYFGKRDVPGSMHLVNDEPENLTAIGFDAFERKDGSFGIIQLNAGNNTSVNDNIDTGVWERLSVQYIQSRSFYVDGRLNTLACDENGILYHNDKVVAFRSFGIGKIVLFTEDGSKAILWGKKGEKYALAHFVEGNLRIGQAKSVEDDRKMADYGPQTINENLIYAKGGLNVEAIFHSTALRDDNGKIMLRQVRHELRDQLPQQAA